jgi:phosphatidylserine/phosphatidylglycerophosphate/cardiolipin synthase-like enzyme
MIIDGEDPAAAAVYNGSANFSAKALTWSFENITRYHGAEWKPVVDAFRIRFDRLFDAALTAERLAEEEGMTVPDPPGGMDACRY